MRASAEDPFTGAAELGSTDPGLRRRCLRPRGAVSFEETLRASADGESLTLTYSIYAGTRELARGTAVLERVHRDSVVVSHP